MFARSNSNGKNVLKFMRFRPPSMVWESSVGEGGEGVGRGERGFGSGDGKGEWRPAGKVGGHVMGKPRAGGG